MNSLAFPKLFATRSSGKSDGAQLSNHGKQAGFKRILKARISCGAAIFLALAGGLRAQTVNVTILHPAGAATSSGVTSLSLDGDQQGGYVTFDNSFFYAHATLWTGSAGSSLELAGDYSMVNSVRGGQQGGRAGNHATLWAGTAGVSDIHPGKPYVDSVVTCASGTQQGGYAYDNQSSGYYPRACIWAGTAASFQSLHPAKAYASEIFCTSGNQQGGDVDYRASIWAGTTASKVDLQPAGFAFSSVLGTNGTQQGGWVQQLAKGDIHAALWTGTAASFLDLNPPGFGSSKVTGVSSAHQVGVGKDPVTDSDHAGIWTGTAASFLDLHKFLSADYSTSSATCVAESGSVTIVGGTAYNRKLARNEAVIWKITSFAPSPMFHPADVNGDFVITSAEFDAYSTAYINGSTGVKGIAPVPASYATRADFILKEGGSYFNAPSEAPPLIWTPTNPSF